MLRSKKFKLKYYILFLVTCVIPTFDYILDSKGVIVVYISQVLVILFYFCRYKLTVLIGEKKYLYFFSGIFIAYLLLIPLSSIYVSDSLIWRDSYDIYRPLSYIFFFSFPFIILSKRKSIKYIYYSLILSILIVIIFSSNHLFGFFDSFNYLYTKETNIVTRRLSVPYMNPYDMGFYMLLCIPFSVLGFYVDKYLNWIFLLSPCIAIILLTQSRSMVGALIYQVPVLFLVVTYMNNKNYIKTKSFVIGSLIIFFFVVCSFFLVVFKYEFIFSYLILGFERVFFEGGDLGSLTVRLEQIIYAAEKAAENPIAALLGNGPSKSELEYVESSYVYFFFRYGFVGLIFFFIIPLCLSIYKSFMCLKISDKYYERIIFSALLVWFITVPVASIGNNITEQVRLSFFYYFFMGFVIRSYSLMR